MTNTDKAIKGLITDPVIQQRLAKPAMPFGRHTPEGLRRRELRKLVLR